jgi:hypothetical protein
MTHPPDDPRPPTDALDELPDDLRAALDALPVEIEPERELWTGIRSAIEPVGLPRREPRARGGSFALVALAAAAMIAVTSSWITANTLRPAAIPSDDHDQVVAAWERDVRQTTDELMAALAARQDALDPEARSAVELALIDLDEAIADVREALRVDPGNDRLQSALAHAYQRKVSLLRSTAELPDRSAERSAEGGG